MFVYARIHMNIDKKELQTENVVSFLSAYESKIGSQVTR